MCALPRLGDLVKQKGTLEEIANIERLQVLFEEKEKAL